MTNRILNQGPLPELDAKSLQRKLFDLFAFARDVLGYHHISKLHLRWYKELLDHRYILLLSPRGHLKTSAVTVGYSLWRLTQDHNLRISILNEVLGNAKDILQTIKAHISSEKFQELYGHWDTLSSMWTAEKILIPRDKVLKEPSISAAGALGTIVSQHADLIVIDDPHSEKNSQTPNQRKKIISWFQNTVMPILEPSGQLIVCMTRWHKDDLAGHIMSDPGFKNWHVIEQRAEWTDEAGKRQILFPEKWSPEALDQIKANMGSQAYRTQMLNDVAGQEGSDFKIEWLTACRYAEKPKDMNIYIGVDLAAGSAESHSKFAYVVLGIPKGDKDAYVLAAHKDSIQFPEQVKTIKWLCKFYEPTEVGIEANAYQQSMLQVLRVDEETSRLPIKGITTQGDKQRRIRGLALLFENRALRLPESLPELEEELLHFPLGNDDLLDALWLAMEVLRKKKVPPNIRYVSDFGQSRYNDYI
jgi:predicted phage terminase large subunit-like protein